MNGNLKYIPSAGARSSINAANIVTLCPLDKPEESFYQAWLTNQIQQAAQNNFSDLSTGGGGLMTTVFLNAMFGQAPAFDMNRQFAYRGTAPTTLHLDTLLRLRTDIITDYVNPMTSLIKMALPSRGLSLDETINSSIADANLVKEDGQSNSDYLVGLLTGILGSLADLMRTVADGITEGKVSELLSDTYFLKLPNMLDNPIYVYVGNPKSDSIAIKLGPYIIRNLSYTLGKIIMSNNVPDHIVVSIDLESLRTATANSFSKIFVTGNRSNSETEENDSNYYVE